MAWMFSRRGQDQQDQQGEAEPRHGRSGFWQRAGAGVGALAIGAGLILGSGGAVIAVSAAQQSQSASQSQSSTSQQGTEPAIGFGGSGAQRGGGTIDDSGTGAASGGTSSQQTTTEASDEQEAGVVLVETVLGYQSAEAAGTGIVISSDGLVLTNHHVIEGATEIQVTIASTGESYTAEVLGYDDTQDVALLQLQGASGLQTADVDQDGVDVGEQIAAIGNAEGEGQLVAAEGEVTATGQSITTQSEQGSASEDLSNLIEIDAYVVSGDSGGAVKDADGEVVAMTVAASSGTANVTGYAIPIDTALEVAAQIESGTATDTVHVGESAFLGVTVASSSTTQQQYPGAAQGGFGAQGYGSGAGQGSSGSSSGTASSGATVAGVVDGSPAQQAGLAAGDVITAVDGQLIDDAEALSNAIADHAVGDQITIEWTDSSGEAHQATVTLVAGPVA